MWYSLVLIMVLCVGSLVMATGTTYARYRSELRRDVTFEVREPEQVCLGTPDEKGSFSVEAPQWKQQAEGVSRMDLALANGTSDTDFSRQDQWVYLRLVGSAGLWTGQSVAKITLIQEDGTEITAKATPITEGTAMYHTYGAGWIFTFENEEGEELYWTLSGGELSFVSLAVTIDSEELITDSLLRTLVIGKVTGQ